MTHSGRGFGKGGVCRAAFGVFVVVLLALGALGAATGTVAAQSAPAEEFNKTFGGADHDNAGSVVQTSDGGFALAGSTSSFGSGDDDAWLIKTDANGNVEINKTFGGADTDTADSVVQTSDGGFALAGFTESFGSGSRDAWLIKTDANGNKELNKTFSRTDDDAARSVVQTSDGGFALAGRTGSTRSGNIDAWLIKTDANGNEQFDKTFGGSDNGIPGSIDILNSVVETSGGGFALAGFTESFALGGQDAWLIKTDANGNVEINKTFGGDEEQDSAVSVIETSDEGFALSGFAESFGSGSDDAWLIKTDANGNVEINKTFGGADRDGASSIVETSEGGFALAGVIGSELDLDTGRFIGGDAWLIKTDENGNEQFNKTFGGADHDDVDSVVQTSDGGFALGGFTRSFGVGNSDAWLIKLSGSGGASIDDIQTSLSDTDGDGLINDRVEVEVTVSDVNTEKTTVELGESNFDVDVSPTDTSDGFQAQFVTPRDPDSDGTNESVEFLSIGTVSATYTVVANLSNATDGETGTVNVEIGGGTTATDSFTIFGEPGGPLDIENPFGNSLGVPASRSTVINRVVQWNTNGEIGGTSYTRQEIITFVVQWNTAT